MSEIEDTDIERGWKELEEENRNHREDMNYELIEELYF